MHSPVVGLLKKVSSFPWKATTNGVSSNMGLSISGLLKPDAPLRFCEIARGPTGADHGAHGANLREELAFGAAMFCRRPCWEMDVAQNKTAGVTQVWVHVSTYQGSILGSHSQKFPCDNCGWLKMENRRCRKRNESPWN